MASKCMACGDGTMMERTGVFRFEPPSNIPGGTIEIEDAAWRECDKCGEAIIPDALNRALEDEARRRQGLLTPAEIKTIRERTGLTQEQMARLLGVGDKTYTRWESGRSYHNKSSDNLIRLVDQYPQILPQLDAQRRPDRMKLVAEYVEHLQSLKGENRLAMAAHGVELDPGIGEMLRRGLIAVIEARKAG